MRRFVRFSLAPLLLAAALLATLAAPAAAWTGYAVWVTDGDTLDVVGKWRMERVRLYGVDAPESDQAFGLVSRLWLTWMVLGREIEVVPADRDRYGRTVAMVRVNGRSVGEVLVERGMAWVYDSYCTEHVCERMKEQEAQARREGRGLWSDPAPVQPWRWRRR